jgi:hypothetical protein
MEYNDYGIFAHVLENCKLSGAPHGGRLYDTDGSLWYLMNLHRSELIPDLVGFECRYDQNGVAFPWYVLKTGQSGPITQHSIVIRRLADALKKATVAV